jgi:hypothetical protein
MRTLIVVIVLALCCSLTAHAGSITVQKMNGDVSVRHGVTEVWTTVATGDALRPNDTMRTGKNGSATLVVQDISDGTIRHLAIRHLALPPEVIVDMSDVRELTQEELMLKLTMQKVRATPQNIRNDGPQISDAAVVHGTDQNRATVVAENDPQVGRSLLNGTKVLLDNGFYATGVLRTLEVFSMFPALAGNVDNRLALAGAMEKANLRGEAVAEYSAIRRLEGLSAAQTAVVTGRLEALRKSN